MLKHYYPQLIAITIIIIISSGHIVTAQIVPYLFELPLNWNEDYYGCQDQGEFQTTIKDRSMMQLEKGLRPFILSRSRQGQVHWNRVSQP